MLFVWGSSIFLGNFCPFVEDVHRRSTGILGSVYQSHRFHSVFRDLQEAGAGQRSNIMLFKSNFGPFSLYNDTPRTNYFVASAVDFGWFKKNFKSVLGLYVG